MMGPDTWNLSDKIAAIASVVAFLQFGALVATVLIMIFNGRRQLRAYVLLDGGSIRVISDGQGNQFIEGFVNLKNCGQTPAQNCKSWVQIKIDNIGSPPFDQESHGKGGSIIGPGTPFNLPVHYPLTPVETEKKSPAWAGRSKPPINPKKQTRIAPALSAAMHVGDNRPI